MLSLNEVWVQNPFQNPLESFFSRWMEKYNLIDMAPNNLSHTWSNGRKGLASMEKRFDHFFISEGMIENRWEIIPRLEIGGLSDHLSIILEVSKDGLSRPFHMKFNQEWIKEEDYQKMVLNSWALLSKESILSFMQ
jgi:hypothetical protein